MMEYLTVAYFVGLLLGFIVIAVAINEDNLGKLLIDLGIRRPMNNGTALLLVHVLISVWPVLILKPLYNWLKEPCIHD